MKKQTLVFFLSALFFFIINYQISAQDQWVNYTNNYVVTEIIENDDELWISSYGGLAHINQSSKEEVYFNRGNSNIPSNWVNDILLHPNNELWMTTSLGICKLNNDQFEMGSEKLTGNLEITPEGKIVVANFDSLYIQVEGMEFEKIAYPNYVAGIGGFEVDEDGSIYINIINWFAETYVAVYENGSWDILFSDFIYESAFTLNSKGTPYLATGEGLFYYKVNDWLEATSFTNIDLFSINDLHVDANDNFLIEVKSECPKLLKWDGEDLTEIEFIQGECNYTQFIKPSVIENDMYYASNTTKGIYTFTPDEIGEFQEYSQSPCYTNHIVTTLHPNDGSHLIIFNSKIQRIWQGEWSEVFLPADFSNYLIHAYLKDDEIWIASQENVWFQKNSDWNSLVLPNSLTGEIEFMVIGENGDVWIQSGTIIYRFNNDEWTSFDAGDHEITNSIIQDMKVDPFTGDLWIATFLGVRQYDGNTWKRYDFSPVNHTFQLALSSEGTYVRADGLYLIYNDEIFEITQPPIGVNNSYGSDMKYDFEGEQLFIGANNNLAVRKNQEWKIYNTTNSGVYNGYSNDLQLDNNGNLWMAGSQGGIDIFNPEGVILSSNDFLNPKQEIQVDIYPTILETNTFFIESSEKGEYQLTIVDQLGAIVKRKTVFLSDNVISCEIPEVASSIIYVIVENEKGLVTKKLVNVNH